MKGGREEGREGGRGGREGEEGEEGEEVGEREGGREKVPYLRCWYWLHWGFVPWDRDVPFLVERVVLCSTLTHIPGT